MKPRPLPHSAAAPRRQAGLMLLECLVYLGVFALILTFAFGIFFQSWQNEHKLRRNANEITAALNAGERWRADLRAATGPVQLTGTTNEPGLRIPQAQGEVSYLFWHGGVWRDDPRLREPNLLLGNVTASRMAPDPRQKVTAWRWDIELKSREHKRLVRPLFTFLAVPPPAAAPAGATKP